MRKHTIRSLKNVHINMLTCYDFQTAQILDKSAVDIILVGDSVGNVILGYETTIEVSLDEMKIFCAAVKRGAPNKFVVGDLPFGSYATYEDAINNAIDLFKSSKVEAIKLEGASETNFKIIKRLTEIGIPVMGHIGLMPQSVHSQGGYYKHGKTSHEKNKLMQEAIALEDAGCFAVVLECVESDASKVITEKLTIPTIGIGSGPFCQGQVLVLNDLLGMTPNAPNFVKPLANFYLEKSKIIDSYLNNNHDTYN